jgi:transposase-like protein
MRRHISKAEKEVALRMSLESGASDETISKYTGIRPRTMRRIRAQFEKDGEVVKKPVVAGRSRLLNSLDAMVSPSFIYINKPFLSFRKVCTGPCRATARYYAL